ncbi:MAG: hypothetical protein ACK40G_00605 [Cytophagaceae bacterium]
MHVITFDNVLEKVVNNRSLSRKEKQIAVQRFLKENSGKGKQTSPEQTEIIESLKAVRKNYLLKDKEDKMKELNTQVG